MPKLAFSTLACPDWPLDRVLERRCSYGYDGVEIRQIFGQTDLLKVAALHPSQHSELRRRLADGNIAICGLASSVRFDYPEAAAREAQFDIGRAYVELAAALGARFVRVFGDVLPSGPPAARAAALEPIADGAQPARRIRRHDAGPRRAGDARRFLRLDRGRRADAANSVAVCGHSLGYASSLEVLRRAAGPNVGSPAAVGLAHALERLGQPPRRSGANRRPPMNSLQPRRRHTP